MAEELKKTASTEDAEPKVETEKVEKDDVEIKVEPKKVEDVNKSYTAEEVNNLLAENTRLTTKTVKDQLYPEIERNKNKLKDSNNKLKELESSKPKSEADKKEMDKEKDKLNSQLESASNELTVAKEKLKALEDVTVKAVERVNELDTKLTEKELSEYRLLKINSLRNKGENLIDSLVIGKTKEEIDASVEKAKLEYQNVVNGVRKNLNLPSVEDEKKQVAQREQEKQEVEKLANVSRLASDSDFKNWKGTREEILKNAYRAAGVKGI